MRAIQARHLDRRSPRRGDQRRTALLQALDLMLKTSELDTVNVGDISREAGVTRSAFYFYFENKAAAVGALVAEMYDDIVVASGPLISQDGEPVDRIRSTIRGIFEVWEHHQHLYRAMLEARQTNRTVRDLWDADRESFVGPVASMIDAERLAGRAMSGPDSRALASVLLELNDRALERLARGGLISRDQHCDVLVAIWLRTIYGSSS